MGNQISAGRLPSHTSLLSTEHVALTLRGRQPASAALQDCWPLLGAPPQCPCFQRGPSWGSPSAVSLQSTSGALSSSELATGACLPASPFQLCCGLSVPHLPLLGRTTGLGVQASRSSLGLSCTADFCPVGTGGRGRLHPQRLQTTAQLPREV